MTERDDAVSRRYRRLAREEPPAALDAAILAASRRAVGSRPGGLRRWAGPVSIAAVLVLGIGVTLRMQHEKPGIESSMPSEYAMPAPAEEPPAVQPTPPAQARQATPAAPETPAVPKRSAAPASSGARRADRAVSAAKPSPPALDSLQKRDPAPELSRREMSVQTVPPSTTAATPPAMRSTVPATATAPPPAAGASAPAATGELRAAPAEELAPAPLRAKRGVASSRDESRAVAAPDPLQAELERIARLRAAGRDEEADKALEEFRRKHPDYRIPEAMRERLERR